MSQVITVSTGSIGMQALGDYLSSPSSTGSWMFYDLPDILISTGGRSQTFTQNDDESDTKDHSSRLLWLKRPRYYKRS